MAVAAETLNPRAGTLFAQLSIAVQTFGLFYSLVTLAVLQFLRHSLPAKHVIHVPLDVVLLFFGVAIVLPATVLAVVDLVLAKADATGSLVRRFRRAVFAVALVLILRQLQLYTGPVNAFIGVAAPLKAEVLLFGLTAVGLIWASLRWHEAFRQFFLYCAPVALVLFGVAFVQLAPLTQLPPTYTSASPSGNPSNPPVFVIMMDELAYEPLVEGGEIDAAAFPNLAALAADSAWLTNATTNHFHTNFTVPKFVRIAGTLSDDYQVRVYGQYRSVESLLWDECGKTYTCRGSAYITSRDKISVFGTLVRRGLFQASPGALDELFTPVTGWLQGNFGSPPPPDVDRYGFHTLTERQLDVLLGDVNPNTAPGTVFFYHSLASHSPFVIQRDGSVYSSPANGDPGDRAPILARYREQLMYVDSLIGMLVDRLKNQGLYDDAVIIVTGDHGLRLEKTSGLSPEGMDVDGLVTRIPFLVHSPGIEPGYFDADYQHVDFEATLLDILGRDASATGGVSAFATGRAPREKVFYVDNDDKRYWKYIYDEENDSWEMVEYVEKPLSEELPK